MFVFWFMFGKHKSFWPLYSEPSYWFLINIREKDSVSKSHKMFWCVNVFLFTAKVDLEIWKVFFIDGNIRILMGKSFLHGKRQCKSHNIFGVSRSSFSPRKLFGNTWIDFTSVMVLVVYSSCTYFLQTWRLWQVEAPIVGHIIWCDS